MANVPDEDDERNEDAPFPEPTQEQLAALTREQRDMLQERVCPPLIIPGEDRRRAQEERRQFARGVFETLEKEHGDLLASVDDPAAREGPTPWGVVHALSAATLDVRAEAIRHVREVFRSTPARWPGRWQRVRALRVAWAMGEFAERVGFGYVPAPTSTLLAEIQTLAGREWACAVRHPEIIHKRGGPMGAPQAARMSLLYGVIAAKAAEVAETAPAFGSARPDERGALGDAIVDFLHAVAPLSEAGDVPSKLAKDLASALRVYLATAGQRDDAQEISAVAADNLPLDDDPGHEQIRDLLRAVQQNVRPRLGWSDPFADENVKISPHWRPSRQDATNWLNSWRQALAMAPSAWTPAEQAGAAFVMIAELRGWGAAHDLSHTFKHALQQCVGACDQVPKKWRDCDANTIAILRALEALGHDSRDFLVAESESDRHARGRKALEEQRASDLEGWRRRVGRAIRKAGGVNGDAAAALSRIGVEKLREWVESDAEPKVGLAAMVSEKYPTTRSPNPPKTRRQPPKPRNRKH